MNVKGIRGVLATFALSFIASSCQWLARPAATLGYVSTVAGLSGEFAEPFGIAVKGRTIFVSDGQTDRIFRLEGDKAIVFAEGLDTPSGIAFDERGSSGCRHRSRRRHISRSEWKVTTLAKGCAGSRHEILETGADQTRLMARSVSPPSATKSISPTPITTAFALSSEAGQHAGWWTKRLP